ncbi:hypothetical protein RUND412_007435 [Rhizina undulata]
MSRSTASASDTHSIRSVTPYNPIRFQNPTITPIPYQNPAISPAYSPISRNPPSQRTSRNPHRTYPRCAHDILLFSLLPRTPLDPEQGLLRTQDRLARNHEILLDQLRAVQEELVDFDVEIGELRDGHSLLKSRAVELWENGDYPRERFWIGDNSVDPTWSGYGRLLEEMAIEGLLPPISNESSGLYSPPPLPESSPPPTESTEPYSPPPAPESSPPGPHSPPAPILMRSSDSLSSPPQTPISIRSGSSPPPVGQSLPPPPFHQLQSGDLSQEPRQGLKRNERLQYL